MKGSPRNRFSRLRIFVIGSIATTLLFGVGAPEVFAKVDPKIDIKKAEGNLLTAMDRNITSLILMPTAYRMDRKEWGFNGEFMFTQYIGEFTGSRKPGASLKNGAIIIPATKNSTSFNPIITQYITSDVKFTSGERSWYPAGALGFQAAIAVDLSGQRKREQRTRAGANKFHGGIYAVTSKTFFPDKAQLTPTFGFFTAPFARMFAWSSDFTLAEDKAVLFAGLESWLYKQKIGFRMEYIQSLGTEDKSKMINFDIKGWSFPILINYTQNTIGKSFNFGINFRLSIWPKLDEEYFKKTGIIRAAGKEKQNKEKYEYSDEYVPIE